MKQGVYQDGIPHAQSYLDSWRPVETRTLFIFARNHSKLLETLHDLEKTWERVAKNCCARGETNWHSLSAPHLSAGTNGWPDHKQTPKRWRNKRSGCEKLRLLRNCASSMKQHLQRFAVTSTNWVRTGPDSKSAKQWQSAGPI